MMENRVKHRTGVVLWSTALVLSACSSSHGAEAIPSSSPVPAAVSCGDAASFQHQAEESESSANKNNNYNGSLQKRAEGTFWGAMAIAATLECSVQSPQADTLLTHALAEANSAKAANDYREATADWTEATVIAQQAITSLVVHLPQPTSK